MKPSGTVLILASAIGDWRGAMPAFSGYRVLHAKTQPEALATLADAHVDLIFVEERPQGLAAALDFLATLRRSHPDVFRMLVVLPETRLTRRAVMDAGIHQFLRQPLDLQQLALTAQRGLEQRELQRRQKLLARDFKLSEDWRELALQPGGPPLPGENRNFEKLVYVSEKMSRLCDLAREAAHTDQPVLIQGETGTGKELLARAVHFHSRRCNGPFLIQNCRTTDASLQAELLGQDNAESARGGDVADGIGLIRAASGGTLLLDEVSEIPPSLQSMLLCFLQTGEIKPMGTGNTARCDVRLLTTSSQPLAEMVSVGKFRQDLYFCLRGFELELPPLRERPEDIPVLAEFFTAKHGAGIGRRILGISANALEKLAAYPFPGNVRELENEIRRMVALAKDGSYLTADLMSPALLTPVKGKSLHGEDNAPEGRTLKEQIESLEKRLVCEALVRNRWNRSRVAEELGLSRVGLANKIRRYGLSEHPSGPR